MKNGCFILLNGLRHVTVELDHKRTIFRCAEKEVK